MNKELLFEEWWETHRRTFNKRLTGKQLGKYFFDAGFDAHEKGKQNVENKMV